MRFLIVFALLFLAGCAGPGVVGSARAASSPLPPGPYKFSENHFLVDGVAYRYLVLTPNNSSGKRRRS